MLTGYGGEFWLVVKSADLLVNRKIEQPPYHYGVAHAFWFRLGINLDKLGQLADELEAQALAEKIHDSARRKRPRSRAQR